MVWNICDRDAFANQPSTRSLCPSYNPLELTQERLRHSISRYPILSYLPAKPVNPDRGKRKVLRPCKIKCEEKACRILHDSTVACWLMMRNLFSDDSHHPWEAHISLEMLSVILSPSQGGFETVKKWSCPRLRSCYSCGTEWNTKSI